MLWAAGRPQVAAAHDVAQMREGVPKTYGDDPMEQVALGVLNARSQKVVLTVALAASSFPWAQTTRANLSRP